MIDYLLMLIFKQLCIHALTFSKEVTDHTESHIHLGQICPQIYMLTISAPYNLMEKFFVCLIMIIHKYYCMCAIADYLT